MVALASRQQTADQIIEAAIGELRRNRNRIAEFLPCRVIIHFPPEGSRDMPCLEIQAKMPPTGLSCDQ